MAQADGDVANYYDKAPARSYGTPQALPPGEGMDLEQQRSVF